MGVSIIHTIHPTAPPVTQLTTPHPVSITVINNPHVYISLLPDVIFLWFLELHHLITAMFLSIDRFNKENINFISKYHEY